MSAHVLLIRVLTLAQIGFKLLKSDGTGFLILHTQTKQSILQTGVALHGFDNAQFKSAIQLLRA